MFDWFLNRPVSYRQPFYFSNFETLKVEKKIVYPRVGNELADKKNGDRDTFVDLFYFLSQ